MALPKLRVGPSKRHLETDKGKAFFYCGDTAWELLHRGSREDILLYLDDRASKGFNVVHTVFLAEIDGLRVPNKYGELPLHDLDPTQINQAYLEHLDFLITEANNRKLYVGLLPSWGDKWNLSWGKGPEVITPNNAKLFTETLSHRYGEAGVIWILGGDREPQTEIHWEINRAMAAGIKTGAGNDALISYHMGQDQEAYAAQLWQEDWLDFFMIQSGHIANMQNNYDRLITLSQWSPTKPYLDGESCYEDHPIMDHNFTPIGEDRFQAKDVRQSLWFGLTSGSCGINYGAHSVWQMYDDHHATISGAIHTWRQALHLPGAGQIHHLRRLAESLPWHEGEVRPDLVVSEKNTPHVGLLAKSDCSWVLAYSTEFPIRLHFKDTLFTESTYKVTWLNPETGKITCGGIVHGRNILLETLEPEKQEWAVTMRRQS